MISLQGTDIVNGEKNATFSGETGGMIKAYGNVYAEKSSNFKLVTHKQLQVLIVMRRKHVMKLYRLLM